MVNTAQFTPDMDLKNVKKIGVINPTKQTRNNPMYKDRLFIFERGSYINFIDESIGGIKALSINNDRVF